MLQGLTKKEIAANSVGYLLAGFENISATMSFVVYCLATNPEVQERLQAEIDDKIGETVGLNNSTSSQNPFINSVKLYGGGRGLIGNNYVQRRRPIYHFRYEKSLNSTEMLICSLMMRPHSHVSLLNIKIICQTDSSITSDFDWTIFF